MKLCLDANCIIYLVERNPIWAPKLVARLAQATASQDTIAVCNIARTECLIGPLRSGDAAVLADYERFFRGDAVEMLAITSEVCERAARIRVASGMKIKLPDAIHLASAVEHGCGLFLTNDVGLAMCPAVPVEVLT